MKRIILVALSAFMIMALAGCGDGTTVVVTPPVPPPPVLVTTDILSDPAFDGDISETFFVNRSINTQNVVAGIDPNSGLEYRAFLDFHLTGAGGVPGNAIIDSAFLDIFINNVFPQSIPLQIDLVSFQPPNLIGSDFNRPALSTILVTPSISPAAIGSHVSIDVTPLMDEAQRLGLLDFQIRIMEDLRFNTLGLIEINNTTGVNRSTLAPLLTVTYF